MTPLIVCYGVTGSMARIPTARYDTREAAEKAARRMYRQRGCAFVWVLHWVCTKEHETTRLRVAHVAEDAYGRLWIDVHSAGAGGFI